MTNESFEQYRERVSAELGPFPQEVSDVHLQWMRATVPLMWERGDIPRQLRAAATLGACLALGAQHELAGHVRRAVTINGLTRHEVAEILRHCSLYAGVPRANEALRTARRVFDEIDARGTQE